MVNHLGNRMFVRFERELRLQRSIAGWGHWERRYPCRRFRSAPHAGKDADAAQWFPRSGVQSG